MFFQHIFQWYTIQVKLTSLCYKMGLKYKFRNIGMVFKIETENCIKGFRKNRKLSVFLVRSNGTYTQDIFAHFITMSYHYINILKFNSVERYIGICKVNSEQYVLCLSINFVFVKWMWICLYQSNLKDSSHTIKCTVTFLIWLKNVN